ncbi:MAG: recombinase family protein [Nannocystaceae bacterium]|nr:recombinase family protein [bacterium]
MTRRKHHLDRGVGYVRTSTSRQDLSPEAQRHAIEDWAARHGVTIVAWGEDVGVSGSVHPLERAGFGQALHEMDLHRAGTLLVARLDRLTRRALDHGVIEADFAKTNRRLVTADGVGNGSSAEAKLIRSVLAAVGEYERRLIAARTRAALAAKRRRRERTSHLPPLGYRFDPMDPQKLAPDWTERANIRRAAELKRAGHTWNEVAEVMTAEGRKPRGRAWTAKQLSRWMSRCPDGFIAET